MRSSCGEADAAIGRVADAAAAALLIGMPQARADLLIAADIGGTTFNCADNQAGCDLNPTTGILQLADQTINGVQVNGSIQTSTITATPNTLNTSSLSVINNSGATRTISVYGRRHRFCLAQSPRFPLPARAPGKMPTVQRSPSAGSTIRTMRKARRARAIRRAS